MENKIERKSNNDFLMLGMIVNKNLLPEKYKKRWNDPMRGRVGLLDELVKDTGLSWNFNEKKQEIYIGKYIEDLDPDWWTVNNHKEMIKLQLSKILQQPPEKIKVNFRSGNS